MQKAILQKTVWRLITILLLALCFYFLSKNGVQPLLATILIIFIKGVIRFVFRMTVMLVSIAIVIFLIVCLIGFICI